MYLISGNKLVKFEIKNFKRLPRIQRKRLLFSATFCS